MTTNLLANWRDYERPAVLRFPILLSHRFLRMRHCEEASIFSGIVVEKTLIARKNSLFAFTSGVIKKIRQDPFTVTSNAAKKFSYQLQIKFFTKKIGPRASALFQRTIYF